MFPVSLTIVPELFTVELSSSESAALITLSLSEPLIFMVPLLSIVNPESPKWIQLVILVHVNDPADVTVKSSVIVFDDPAGSVSALTVISVEIVSAFKFAENIKKKKKDKKKISQERRLFVSF